MVRYTMHICKSLRTCDRQRRAIVHVLSNIERAKDVLLHDGVLPATNILVS